MGMSVIGKRIRIRLEELGKTQQWLADEADMSQQGIGSILSGDSERPRKLREIARALQTSQEYLLGETDDPTPLPADDTVFGHYVRLSVAQKQAVTALIETFRKSGSNSKPPASPQGKGRARRL